MIPVGIQQFASIAPKYLLPERMLKSVSSSAEVAAAADPMSALNSLGDEEILNIRAEDLEGMYIQSLGVEILQQNEDGKRYAKEYVESGSDPVLTKEEVQRISREDVVRGTSSSSQYEGVREKDILQSVGPAGIPTKLPRIPKQETLPKSDAAPAFAQATSSKKVNLKPLSKSKPSSVS
jgi:hypothetical protein